MNQKVQFYSDASCGAALGSPVDLGSATDESYAWTAPDVGTYSFVVSSVDSGGNSVASACSTSIVVEKYFYQGIATGGDATARTIDGHLWLTGADAVTAGMTFPSGREVWSSAAMTLSPAVDSETAAMLNNGTWHDDADVSIAYPIANGGYQVYIWTAESYDDNFRLFDLTFEGETVDHYLGSQAYAHWTRYGPYTANVTDGSLDLTLVRIEKGDPLIAGLEIYRSAIDAATTLSLTDDFSMTTHFLRECSPMTVHRLDANGAPAVPASALTVTLTKDLGEFYSDATCTTTAATATIAANQSEARVYYKSTVAGAATLTASASGVTDGTLSMTTSTDLFRDDFAGPAPDLKWIPWTSAPMPPLASGRLELTPAANTAWSWPGLNTWHHFYDFRNASLVFEVSQVLNSSPDTYTDLYACDAADCLTIEVWNGIVHLKMSSGSVDYGGLTYDSTSMRFMRFRFDTTGGNDYFETSPDGTTWTTRKTVSSSVVNASTIEIDVGAGTGTNGVASPGSAYVEQIYATQGP